MTGTLVRRRRGRVVAGVCAALGDRFNVSPWPIRALFVISCILPGPQVLLYLLLWILIPRES